MKKRKLKNLSLNRKIVSNFKTTSVKGGMVSQECSEVYYQDEDGYYVCCSFQGC